MPDQRLIYRIQFFVTSLLYKLMLYITLSNILTYCVFFRARCCYYLAQQQPVRNWFCLTVSLGLYLCYQIMGKWLLVLSSNFQNGSASVLRSCLYMLGQNLHHWAKKCNNNNVCCGWIYASTAFASWQHHVMGWHFSIAGFDTAAGLMMSCSVCSFRFS